jgi:phosphatidylserine/phosphatidylglycerophosphate/cardiolipin synthase-like enzyme
MRPLFLVTLAVLIFSACAPLPATAPAPDITSAPVTDTPFGDVPPIEPPVTVPAVPTLEALPVHVGYGYRGTWFEIYFTDPTNPAAKQDSGGVEEAVIASIDSARLTVDVAFYSFSLREVANALLRARDRGVQVRVVMESDNREKTVPQALIDAGIPILGDRREGLMHDKFIVIDRSEVWTGSMNFTVNGAYEDNNNLIHIRSVKVTENYLTEFEEMYTDDLFGPDSIATTPNPFLTVDGVDIETYFSPDDGVAARLLDLLGGAQESVYFMAYSFTSDEIAQTLRELWGIGVDVKGVMDDSQVKSNQGAEFDLFNQAGVEVRRDGNPGLMHHKVIIIDRRIVVTGSYNFTASAEDRNDENLLIIYDPQIAELFLAEFQRVFQQATAR